MPTPLGAEPIADDELLYRRIPASLNLYDPSAELFLLPDAFRPNASDTTGLSLYRSKYKSIEDVARGREGKTYYVAVLRAGDLRAAGIAIVPRPLEGDPGHVELPGLTYENRKSDRPIEWKSLLALKLCIKVEGPFHS